MNKRERLARTIAGEPTDRTPIAFWRHWPGDDQRAADFARALLDFQRSHDLDFLRVMPAQTWAVSDHGLQDEWRGALDGTRHITRHVVQRSLDWSSLRPLMPLRGVVGRQLQTLRLVTAGLDADTPVIMSLPSPLTPGRTAGRTHPFAQAHAHAAGAPAEGLGLLTTSTLRIIDELRQLPLAGICYELSLASHDIISREEYQVFGWNYDKEILGNLPGAWWFNLASLPENTPIFSLAGELRLSAVNWEDQQGEPDLVSGRSQLFGAACCGLSAREQLHDGTPATILNRARTALQLCGGRRFILAPGSPLLVTTPLSNLRAMRQAVEPGGNVA